MCLAAATALAASVGDRVTAAPGSPDPSAFANAGDGLRRRSPVVRVQAQGQPVLNVSKVILAEPSAETPLPIQVGPAEAIARNSFIRIRGLPPSAALTEGHSIAPGSWAIPILALPNLKIRVPVGQNGKSDVTVALVTVDGTVVAESKTALVVAAAALIAPADSEPKSRNVASLGPATPASPQSGEDSARQSPAALTDAQKQGASFLSKGNEQIAQGNIASARLFLERAAEAGLAQGALDLATTYDPLELERLGARGVQPNPALAKKWYERAKQLGAAEADERLRRLGQR